MSTEYIWGFYVLRVRATLCNFAQSLEFRFIFIPHLCFSKNVRVRTSFIVFLCSRIEMSSFVYTRCSVLTSSHQSIEKSNIENDEKIYFKDSCIVRVKEFVLKFIHFDLSTVQFFYCVTRWHLRLFVENFTHNYATSMYNSHVN